MEFHHDDELPTFGQLVAEVCELLGTDCNLSGGRHIVLNTLDAGAIYMTSHPTRSQDDVRFATTEDPEDDQ